MRRLTFLICAGLTFPQLVLADACSTTGQAMQQSANSGLNKALNDIYAKGDQQSKSVSGAQSCLEKYSQYQIGATVNVPDLDLGKMGDALKKQAESKACQVDMAAGSRLGRTRGLT